MFFAVGVDDGADVEGGGGGGSAAGFRRVGGAAAAGGSEASAAPVGAMVAWPLDGAPDEGAEVGASPSSNSSAGPRRRPPLTRPGLRIGPPRVGCAERPPGRTRVVGSLERCCVETEPSTV